MGGVEEEGDPRSTVTSERFVGGKLPGRPPDLRQGAAVGSGPAYCVQRPDLEGFLILYGYIISYARTWRHLKMAAVCTGRIVCLQFLITSVLRALVGWRCFG